MSGERWVTVRDNLTGSTVAVYVDEMAVAVSVRGEVAWLDLASARVVGLAIQQAIVQAEARS